MALIVSDLLVTLGAVATWILTLLGLALGVRREQKNNNV